MLLPGSVTTEGLQTKRRVLKIADEEKAAWRQDIRLGVEKRGARKERKEPKGKERERGMDDSGTRSKLVTREKGGKRIEEARDKMRGKAKKKKKKQ